MTTTEDRARAAMRAIAATVNDAPALRLAPSAASAQSPATAREPAPAGDSELAWGLSSARDHVPAADEVRFGPRGPGQLRSRRPPRGRKAPGPRDPETPARKHRLGLPGPGSAIRPGSRRQGRHWRSWLAPVAVAAVVVALAITLAVIKNLPNDSAVPPSTSTSTVLGDIPPYYVALQPTSAKANAPNSLLVGDSLTGKALATFAPSPGTSFESVSGANDDRTFVVFDVAQSTGTSASTQVGTWFEVKLAPGTAHPATLTRLPIEPGYAQVAAMALSASGQELAVAGVPAGHGQRGIEVFSLATGRLLQAWTTDNATAVVPDAFLDGVTQWPALTWIDGDQAIAFTTYDASQLGINQRDTITEGVRKLPVGGARTGDVMEDSQLIWSAQATAQASSGLPCAARLPLVGADGQTASCYSLTTSEPPPTTGSIPWTLTFVTYHLATTGSARETTAYTLTKREPQSASAVVGLLWASPSGAALIGEWAVGSGATATSVSPVPNGGGTNGSAAVTITRSTPTDFGSVHIGVISDGTFTPLRLPPGFTPVTAPAIAW